jgi:hypothetical protein
MRHGGNEISIAGGFVSGDAWRFATAMKDGLSQKSRKNVLDNNKVERMVAGLSNQPGRARAHHDPAFPSPPKLARLICRRRTCT